MNEQSPKRNAIQQPITAPVLWSLLIRAIGTLASFATGVLLARILQPEGFGIYGMVIALSLVLSVIAQAGLSTLALREVAVATETGDWPLMRGVTYWFWRLMVVTSVAVAAVYLVGLWAYQRLTGQELPFELVYAAPLLPFLAIVSLIYAQLRGLHHYLSGQSLDILIRPALFLLLSAAVFLLSGRLTPEIALLLQIPAGVATLICGFLWLRRALPPETFAAQPKSQPKAWRRAALPLALSDVLQQVNAVYGLIIVGALSAPSEAGFLRVALSAIVFIATPLSVFNVVLAPRLAQLHAAGKSSEIQSLLVGSAAVMSAFCFAALAALYLVGQPLLETFFGPAYGHAWAPLMLLTGAQAIISLFGVGWVLLSVSGAERKLTQAFMVSTSIAIVAAALLVPSFGAVGAGWAAVVGSLVQNLMCWHFLRASGLESSVLGLFGSRGSGVSPFDLFRQAPPAAIVADIEKPQPMPD